MAKLGSGAYGEVFRFEQKPGEIMALKQFKGSEETARTNARKAHGNYVRAREAGLRVLPEYRLTQDERGIVMTCLGQDGQICAAVNNRVDSPERANRERIDRFTNFSRLAERMLQEARTAAQRGIGLLYDSFLFTFPPGRKEARRLWGEESIQSAADFYIADMDKVMSRSMAPDELLRFNMQSVRSALESLIQNHVSARYQEAHRVILRKMYGKTAVKRG